MNNYETCSLFLFVKSDIAKSEFSPRVLVKQKERRIQYSLKKLKLKIKKNIKGRDFYSILCCVDHWTSLVKQNMIRLAFFVMDSIVFKVKTAYINYTKSKKVIFYMFLSLTNLMFPKR